MMSGNFELLYVLARTAHIVAAAIWVGGMITMAVLVVALRRAGAPRPMLQKVARAFAHLSWAAMAVSILTGLSQIELLHISWSYPRLHLKLALVGLMILVAGHHHFRASQMTPAQRGATQVALMVLGIATIAAAVRL